MSEESAGGMVIDAGATDGFSAVEHPSSPADNYGRPIPEFEDGSSFASGDADASDAPPKDTGEVVPPAKGSVPVPAAPAVDGQSQAAPATAVPAHEAIGEALLQFAEQHFDLPRDVAMSFGTASKLEAWLYKVHQSRQAAGGQQPAPAESQSPAPSAPAPVAPTPEQLFGKYKLELHPDLDEGLVQQMQGMNTHYARQLAQMADVVGHMIRNQRYREGQETLDRFERWRSSVDDSAKTLLGDKPGRELARDSKELAASSAVFQQAQAEFERAQQMGIPLTFEAACNRALYALHGQELTNLAAQAERSKIQQQARDAQGRFSARPTAREAVPPNLSPNAKAIEAVRQKMREFESASA